MEINSSEFIEKYYSSDEAKHGDVTRFVNLVNEKVTEVYDFSEPEIVCRLFYSRPTNAISRSHYQKIKSYLLNLYDYLGILGDGVIPTRDEVLKQRPRVSYFRSLNSLLDFIDKIGEREIPRYNPTTDLVRLKGFCIFLWYGLDATEIAAIKKIDLQMVGFEKYFLVTSKGEIELVGKPFVVIYHLYGLESYQGLPSSNSLGHGRRIDLKGDSRYLFRTPSAKSPKPEANELIQILKRFNKAISDTNKILSLTGLYCNAIFVRIYDETITPLSPSQLLLKICEYFNCTKNVALSYRQQYLQFVEDIETNKI